MTDNLTPFTVEERASIVKPETPLGRFIAVWDVILARYATDFDHEDQIAPGDYAISHEDAIWCISRIMDAEDHPYRKSNWALEWASRGPSYYKARR